MIRATSTVVLHNFSMYAGTAAKGNAVMITFHGRDWALLGPSSLVTVEEKDAFRVFSSTDAYHKFADCLQAAHDGTVTQVASRGKVRCGFYPVDFLERMRPEDKRIRRKSPIAAA